MSGVNKVILVGRLGSDPEMRYTTDGTPVANFSIATDESYKDRNGEKQKKTTWHKLVLWNKLAEIAQEYLHKGDMIYAEGKIQIREFADRDGNNRTVTEIVVRDMSMLSTNGASKPEKKEKQKSAKTAEAVEAEDEDSPF